MRIFRNTAFSLFTVLLIISAAFCRTQEPEIKADRRFRNIFNGPRRLLEWPDQSVLTGPKRVKSDPPEVRWPKNQCLFWLRHVLAPSWRPPEQTEIFFIRDEFDDIDVVRMSWERNGYNIQLSQTALKMAIKLSPLGEENTGQDVTQKTDKAKQLCLSLFSDNGRRYDRKGNIVTIEGLSKKIAAYSFRPEMIRHLEDKKAVFGKPQRAQEAGIVWPRNNEERIQQDDPNNPDWDKTAHSFSYWFRMIHWCNDGKSVGFYFFKAEDKSPELAAIQSIAADKDFFGTATSTEGVH